MAPADFSLPMIYRSVFPFVMVMIFTLIVLMIFPEIALWLPHSIYGPIRRPTGGGECNKEEVR